MTSNNQVYACDQNYSNKKQNKKYCFYPIHNAKDHKDYIQKIHLKPVSELEIRLHRLRIKHAAYNYDSPTYAKKVIYAVYGINKSKNSPIYVGQTTRTAYERLTQEINVAKSNNSHTPISRYIRKVGEYNISVMVLQNVQHNEHLDYYERK